MPKKPNDRKGNYASDVPKLMSFSRLVNQDSTLEDTVKERIESNLNECVVLLMGGSLPGLERHGKAT